MKFYLDTNVIVDLLLRREPHVQTTIDLFELSIINTVSFFTSSHCIATAHYICKKAINENILRNLLGEILDIISIIPVDEEILRKSLKSSHKDFEDAVQIFCAHQIKNIDGIITRNIKDFSTSEIDVFTPDEAIIYINKKLNK